MWIKTKDGRYYDASHCALFFDKEALTLQPLTGKPVAISEALTEAQRTTMAARIEACLVDRRPLLDLS